MLIEQLEIQQRKVKDTQQERLQEGELSVQHLLTLAPPPRSLLLVGTPFKSQMVEITFSRMCSSLLKGSRLCYNVSSVTHNTLTAFS